LELDAPDTRPVNFHFDPGGAQTEGSTKLESFILAPPGHRDLASRQQSTWQAKSNVYIWATLCSRLIPSLMFCTVSKIPCRFFCSFLTQAADCSILLSCPVTLTPFFVGRRPFHLKLTGSHFECPAGQIGDSFLFGRCFPKNHHLFHLLRTLFYRHRRRLRVAARLAWPG